MSTGALRIGPPRPHHDRRDHEARARRIVVEAAEHVVTVSPDVASSTNLGGWINHGGIWSPGDRVDWFADDPDTLDEDLHRGGATVPARGMGTSAPVGTQAHGVRRDQVLEPPRLSRGPFAGAGES